jgi:hypothetical protein
VDLKFAWLEADVRLLLSAPRKARDLSLDEVKIRCMWRGNMREARW